MYIICCPHYFCPKSVGKVIVNQHRVLYCHYCLLSLLGQPVFLIHIWCGILYHYALFFTKVLQFCKNEPSITICLKDFQGVFVFGLHLWKPYLDCINKSSLPFRYNVQNLQIYSHIRIAKYILSNWDGRSCGPKKSTYTSLSFFVAVVMLLFRLTIQVDLLPTQGVQSLLIISGSSVSVVRHATVIAKVSSLVTASSFLEVLELSKPMNISTRSYSSFMFSFILSTSFTTLSIYILLIYTSL